LHDAAPRFLLTFGSALPRLKSSSILSWVRDFVALTLQVGSSILWPGTMLLYIPARTRAIGIDVRGVPMRIDDVSAIQGIRKCPDFD
jgi:hypothetical protein